MKYIIIYVAWKGVVRVSGIYVCMNVCFCERECVCVCECVYIYTRTLDFSEFLELRERECVCVCILGR
jgi:hypothetical protein